MFPHFFRHFAIKIDTSAVSRRGSRDSSLFRTDVAGVTRGGGLGGGSLYQCQC
jgi:hypothetical protein